MAITSIGYDGVLDEGGWARGQPGWGHAPFGVDGNSLDLTIPQSAVPQVNLAAGTAFAWGVYDTIDASTQTVPSPPTTNGVVRWDTLVLRRNWSGSGGTTTFAWVTGGTAKAVATTNLNKNPGVLADQPLYLVQSTGGSAVVTAIEDLRTFNPPPIWFIGSDPNLLDPNLFRYGQTLVVSQYGHTLIRRGRSDITPSTANWYNLDDPPWTNLNIGSGMVAGTSAPQYRVRRGELQMRGNGRRVPTTNGGVWTASATANLEVNVGLLPAELAPATHSCWTLGVEGLAPNGSAQSLRAVVNTDGQIFVTLPAGQSFTGLYFNPIRYAVKVAY